MSTRMAAEPPGDLLDRDPLADITNTRCIAAVVGGVLLDRGELQRLVAGPVVTPLLAPDRRPPRGPVGPFRAASSDSGRRGGGHGAPRSDSQGFEELRLWLDDLDCLGAYAEFVVFQKVAKLRAIDQVDGRCSVPDSFTLSVPRESARGQEQPLVGPPNHGSSEVPDFPRADCTGVPLALKAHMERQQIDA